MPQLHGTGSLPPAGLASGSGRGLRWVAAGGTGCYHFLSSDDHFEALHEASEARKLEQRRQRKAEKAALPVICPSDMPVMKMDLAQLRLGGTYEVNGKVFAVGKQATAPPIQSPASHWLCQVNGCTSRFNIVNNSPLHPAVQDRYEQETMRTRTMVSQSPSAGSVQPQRDVACYEMTGYVPVRQRVLPGIIERTYTLFS